MGTEAGEGARGPEGPAPPCSPQLSDLKQKQPDVMTLALFFGVAPVFKSSTFINVNQAFN